MYGNSNGNSYYDISSDINKAPDNSDNDIDKNNIFKTIWIMVVVLIIPGNTYDL